MWLEVELMYYFHDDRQVVKRFMQCRVIGPTTVDVATSMISIKTVQARISAEF